LAQGQRGVDHAEAFDLAAVVGEVLASREGDIAAAGLVLESSLQPAAVSGDARLIARLAANLVDNAICHNIPHGRLTVRVGSPGAATLTVANTGPVVPADAVERLLQPFQRMSRDRTTHGGGLGLGLSIVDAIAGAHGATLSVHALPDGGLSAEVRFPPRPTTLPLGQAPVPLSVGAA
jgi:signal transduction histidine kinase